MRSVTKNLMSQWAETLGMVYSSLFVFLAGGVHYYVAVYNYMAAITTEFESGFRCHSAL